MRSGILSGFSKVGFVVNYGLSRSGILRGILRITHGKWELKVRILEFR